MSYRERTDQPAPGSPRAPQSAHVFPLAIVESASPFSLGVTEKLELVLNRFLASSDRDDAGLRDAIGQLCIEAHDRDLGPEKMLVAVKSAWHDLKLDNALDESRKELAFEHILTACLDAYYDAKRPPAIQ